ncbi:MAG: DUF2169 domain-containing protein [Nitrosomonas sp.]|nr:DUF2169 domain-containing protein [Nitrosomonas sp.]
MSDFPAPLAATTTTIPTDTVLAQGQRVVLPGQSPVGEHIMGILLKRTYDIIPNRVCTRAESDKALNAGDVFWGDPMNSTVRYESDFFPYKLATDVVFNGKAYAPNGTPTTSCLVSLRVAGQLRQIQVMGDRVAHFVKGGLPRFTDPKPFTTIDLRYEYAYGGIDVYSDKSIPYPYPRNPLGRGFVVKNSGQSVDHLPLPNLEDPNDLLTPERLCLGEYSQWENQPFPAGFSWFQKTWLPRAKLAGILPADRAIEQQLRQAYAKLVPVEHREAYINNGLPDMDFHFFNGASRGLIFPYLKGGEEIATANLSPAGIVYFYLPNDKPRLGLDIGFGMQEPEVVMHTVMIRMEENQIDLVWRGAVPYPGRDWLPQMRKMEVLVA